VAYWRSRWLQGWQGRQRRHGDHRIPLRGAGTAPQCRPVQEGAAL